MPVVHSHFAPPAFLRNGHVQTILGALLPRRLPPDCVREQLELSDGDFLDLDWIGGGRARCAIISHGLEGSSRDPCVRGLAAALNACGWDVLAWNFRGCGGRPNRLARFYHSGETGDLGAVIARAAGLYPHLALVGLSLGGNMTLKYLGGRTPHPNIRAAAAISVPVHLQSSALALDSRRGNRLYLGRFMRSLAAKIREKAARFPGEINAAGIRRVRSFAEFDDRFTARLHGFRNAEDYWRRSSSRPLLPDIRVPTLLLNALDDPFLTGESFPEAEALASSALHLETPATGGHLGFVDLGGHWSARRIPDFLSREA
jgi:predicted alpha/beta-fold hydrolase